MTICRIDGIGPSQALHGIEASRRIEARAARAVPAHALMQRAGLAVARLAAAIAPHARQVWIAAGPGNNGGDGFEAALRLHANGRDVTVTALGDPAKLPADAAASLASAVAAGVPVGPGLPSTTPDLAIDALLGLGASRPPSDALLPLMAALNRATGPRLAVDLPSGLHAERGQPLGPLVVEATHTLALLTLKPGLFTGAGREIAGELWFDGLGADAARDGEPPEAWCVGHDAVAAVRRARGHAGHKGRFGDVIAVGGAPGMAGALHLAARAALAGGAGRVFACALDPAMPGIDPWAPELMWRPGLWNESSALQAATVVAGCGGGQAIHEALPIVISRAHRLVLDADALNAMAGDPGLQALLQTRARQDRATVLTPHPLEAARLLGMADAGAVQSDRLRAAQSLADRYGCIVLLKGSGSVIAAPGRAPAINPTGNARLATAGTGDVLAGWLAGLWAGSLAARTPASAFEVAQAAAHGHGAAAHDGDPASPLSASQLVARLATAD